MKNDPQRSRSSDPSIGLMIIITALVSLFWLSAQSTSDQVWNQLEAHNRAHTEREAQRQYEKDQYDLEQLEIERELFRGYPQHQQQDTGDQ